MGMIIIKCGSSGCYAFNRVRQTIFINPSIHIDRLNAIQGIIFF